MSNGHVVFISGAGRGIGKGLVSQYLLQPSTTVIAGLRNPDSESAAQLKSLPSAEKSNLLIVKLDSTSNSDANDAITAIQQTHQIRHIDTVIANAGICDHLQLVANMEIDELARHIDTNVYGVLRLFQATWPILQNSASPKFVCVSSRMGSIGQAASDEGATGAYGLSKAATNFLVTKMAAENKGLIAFCVDPGLVQTDMGNRGAAFAGLAEAPLTLKDCAAGIMSEVESATRENCVGHFRSFDGKVLPW